MMSEAKDKYCEHCGAELSLDEQIRERRLELIELEEKLETIYKKSPYLRCLDNIGVTISNNSDPYNYD